VDIAWIVVCGAALVAASASMNVFGGWGATVILGPVNVTVSFISAPITGVKANIGP